MTYDHLMTNEEAIEELKKVDTLDMPVRLCEAYYMSIKALEQETKWIPVSERLPKAYQKVLVTYEEFHWANEPATYGVKVIPFGGRVDFIAWMPLPEPYKAESGE